MNVKNKYSVFLVDDNKMFLTSMKNSLEERFGKLLKLSEYSTGEECMEHIDEHPDIVFLDYYMNTDGHPNAMDGIKVMGEIKSISKDSIVVIVSGQDKLEVALDAVKHGAYDYIAKSESVFVRVQSTIINAMQHIKSSRVNKKYFGWNITLAIIIISIVVIDIIWFTLSH